LSAHKVFFSIINTLFVLNKTQMSLYSSRKDIRFSLANFLAVLMRAFNALNRKPAMPSSSGVFPLRGMLFGG
jgi:hypothetical protein